MCQSEKPQYVLARHIEGRSAPFRRVDLQCGQSIVAVLRYVPKRQSTMYSFQKLGCTAGQDRPTRTGQGQDGIAQAQGRA